MDVVNSGIYVRKKERKKKLVRMTEENFILTSTEILGNFYINTGNV